MTASESRLRLVFPGYGFASTLAVATFLSLERISFERMGRAKTLYARLFGHDSQEVIPALAGIQEPYIQLQTALG